MHCFFFQAEDGIRDYKVTGVQTCALPISPGSLVLGERLQTFDPGERRYVMTKGEIARSYRPLDTRDGWLWLVEVALSREVTVVLEVRAPASWPVESVSVTADHVP